MGSSGKGSGSSQALNYYGTVAGGICWGPIDTLYAIIINGGYLFQGTLSLTSDMTDLTGSLVDPSYLISGGYLRIYRGTETQPADGALSGHPPYLGTAYIVANGLFFGEDSGTCPNLQVIVGRTPRVSTTIVASADNITYTPTGGYPQVNPVAAWAELLTDERGLNIPLSKFDTTSWLASAHWCAQDTSHQAFTFMSPLINETTAARDIYKALLDPFNGFCYWNSAGNLCCSVYEWGTNPGGLQTLDSRYWTKRPQIPLGDWTQVPTELVVRFTDSAYEFQENTILVPDARAAQIRQEDDQRSLDRIHVTNSTQAYNHAVEYYRRIGTAPSTGQIRVRQQFAAGLVPGSKVLVNTDPEPGGTAMAQLCRVEKIEQDRTDEAVITVMTDNLLPATPYFPVLTGSTPSTPTCPAMAYFLPVPLPPASFGWPLAVAIIATRPSPAVIGMEVYLSDSPTGSFADLGSQVNFAARAQLAATILSTDTTIQLTELDGLTGPEANLAANTPGGNIQQANNNSLLILLVSLDSNGRVALDSYGDPVMEFISVANRTLVSGATFSYTVLRGRLDTPAIGWTSGASAWILPKENIVAWTPDHLEALYGSVAYFDLVAYTNYATDTTIPVPQGSVNMLPTTSPMYLRGTAGGNSATVTLYQRATSAPAVPSVALTYTFATALLSGGSLGSWTQTVPTGTNPLYVTTAPAFAFGVSVSIPSAAWSSPVVLAANGQRTAILTVYQWGGSSAPSVPSGTSTYTWATGSYTAPSTPNGWALNPGSGTAGQILWACETVYTDMATTATSSVSWSSPTTMPVGSNGANGVAVNATSGYTTGSNVTLSGSALSSGISSTATTGTIANVIFSGTFYNHGSTSATFSAILYIDGVATSVTWTSTGNIAASGGSQSVALTATPTLTAGSHTFAIYLTGYPETVSLSGTLTVQ
jgi:hypothetical protein